MEGGDLNGLAKEEGVTSVDADTATIVTVTKKNETETPHPSNPTLLLRNMTRLWHVAPDGRRYEIPTDIDWVRNYKVLTASSVDCMTNETLIQARGGQGNCAGTLDVINWIMGQVNANKGCMMVAYGGLLHMHRERDLVNSTTGVLLDNDIDTWASPEPKDT